MAGQILGVVHASAYLKQLIETDDLLSDCWIEGEISEFFKSKQGHLYFTLVEGQVTLRCVMFRGSAARQRRTFNNGDQIVAHGRFSIYEQQGRYQLLADSVQSAGLGLQALQFELLRQKLEAEGLFDETRKRPLPTAPNHIGVVTSLDGAVWHDIQHVLRRRFPLTHLILSPTSVQGEQAPASIAEAIEFLNRDGRAEVMIVGRGGGSADDLAAFNDERVVRAIFASSIPTVSAVGHETDWTLADLVADVRAPTPSAAAEIVSPSIVDYNDEIDDLRSRLADATERHTADQQFVNASLRQRLQRQSPLSSIREHHPLVDQFEVRIGAAGRAGLDRGAAEMVELRSRADHAWGGFHSDQSWTIALRQAALQTLEPQAVLARGYAHVSSIESGAPIQSIRHAKIGESARIALYDGDLIGHIEAIGNAGTKQGSTRS